MKITHISQAIKNPDRVNISVNGKYRFSLDIFQVSELGIRIGNEYSEEELVELETESQFGKLYARALDYCMLRPHSKHEVKDYLWRKTHATKYKSRTGELKERAGVSQEVADRVFMRLVEKEYLDDQKFAKWWVENRHHTKGASRRKLEAELRAKGVEAVIIDQALGDTERNDKDELAKIITKKRNRYDDEQKLIAYLARQGFGYDDIKSALADQG